MGGLGSGEWPRLNCKRSVETTLALSIGNLGRKIHSASEGYLHWKRNRDLVFRVKYTLYGQDRRGIQLEYGADMNRPFTTWIGMSSTQTGFNGLRWWFNCPVFHNSRTCGRRVWKLYLPRSDSVFGCRQCHDLRYRSSQQAHRDERILSRLGFQVDQELVSEFKRHLGRQDHRN